MIEVIHFKSQQAHSRDPAQYFGFEWMLKMVITPNTDHLKVL
jgi:hypothetical protein